jgi:Ca2+-binding EF-hand superfamily protein
MKFTLSSSGSLFAGVLIFATAFVALPAWAHGPNGDFFKKMDLDGDGKVTLTEARSGAKARFAKMDLNHDSVVTRQEALSHHKTQMKKHRPSKAQMRARFNEADKNKNGRIERSESNLPDEWFATIDTNDDGALTPEELNAAFEKRRSADPEAQAWREKHFEMFFSQIDKNDDGKLTQEEAESAIVARFSELDKNGDQAVTRQEARAHWSEKRSSTKSPQTK